MPRFFRPAPDAGPGSPPPARPAPSACPGIDWNEAAIEAGLAMLERYSGEFLGFPEQGGAKQYGYGNPYFSWVDAAVAHSFVRERRFSKIVEVGSGFSTRVLRGALDSNGAGELVSIDPNPRAEIAGIAHEHLAVPVQSLPLEFFAALPPDSLLFIDSSHKATYGSDVSYLLLDVLPALAPGVTIQVHDIFLPEEYPEVWHAWDYSEQYVLQGLLAHSTAFRVLWPGRHVMLTRWPALERFFPAALVGLHCSFWIERTKS
jgi:hypothetical protein